MKFLLRATENISDKLTQMTASRMEERIAEFIMEERRQDSEVYLPKTLLQIIASLQRHLRENGNRFKALVGVL